ncbi:MAG TPA: hypothetical protein VF841_05300, partial [Anaeromyxobacter sp.]
PHATARAVGGAARLHGDARHVAPDALRLDAGGARAVQATEDAAGIRLRARLAGWPAGATVALVAAAPGGGTPPEWLEAVSKPAVLLLATGPDVTDLAIAIRVQEADLALLDATGTPVRRARAELGYVRAT